MATTAIPTRVTPAPPPSDRASDAWTAAPSGFAGVWLAAVEAHDAAATEALISNPLSEYDLVGTRLIELLRETQAQLSSLGPTPGQLGDDVQALDGAISEVQARLEAIDPHGPRLDQAEAFQQALDDWVEHVRPRAEAIRAALGLASVPPGDLQL